MRNSIKLFIVLLLAVGASSCMKENPYPYYDIKGMLEAEAPILKQYVDTAKGLEGAILDDSGIWYKVLEAGAKPERDSEGKLIKTDYYEYNFNNAGQLEVPRVSYSYVGRMLNGKVFDEGTTEKEDDDNLPPAASSYVIEGLNIAFLPKKAIDKSGDLKDFIGLTELGLQKGSKIRVVFPSPYGYQDKGKGVIPADAPLDFTITVLKVLPPLPPR